MKNLIFFLLILNCLPFLGQNVNGFERIENESYFIKYPKTWSKNESGIAGSRFFLFSQLTNESDQFRENINLIIQDLSTYNFSLKEYAKLSEEQIKTLVTNSNILKSEQLIKNGLDFQRIIYTGKQGVYDLKFEQYYWLINKKAYILTFTSEESQFPLFKKEGESILNSFRIH